jgi:hypothetical protein
MSSGELLQFGPYPVCHHPPLDPAPAWSGCAKALTMMAKTLCDYPFWQEQADFAGNESCIVCGGCAPLISGLRRGVPDRADARS